ncbi:MAG: 16S rRNA (cytosine(1402)-N(4))-methyltransferase RsmH [Candidatus Kaiserbacteria bacterium]|nr:16S rRNA (cytosine(1402)-N(4))-methyltransferase RsmH [Candidatus Kaiserbacteria bacterium]
METHTPVLVQEVLEQMAIAPNGIMLDGTVGLGGHAKHLLRAMQGGVFVGIDADRNALTKAQENLAPAPKEVTAHFVESNFRDIAAITKELALPGYDRVLLDLGWGSHQLHSGRGFSFAQDEPLQMCYSTQEGACVVTAFDVVNTFEESNLADIIKGYGGERWAVRIAKHIVEERETAPIATTKKLAAIVAGAIPRRLHPRRLHPATKTFQAIRMTVNDEINTLKQFLEVLPKHMRPEGRIAIIAFHSGESRIVKQTFKKWEEEGFGKRYTKKAHKPTEEECARNPRARSAVLRTFIVT